MASRRLTSLQDRPRCPTTPRTHPGLHRLMKELDPRERMTTRPEEERQKAQGDAQPISVMRPLATFGIPH